MLKRTTHQNKNGSFIGITVWELFLGILKHCCAIIFGKSAWQKYRIFLYATAATIFAVSNCNAADGGLIVAFRSMLDAHTPPLLLAILLLSLPLFGFPISVLYAFCGVIFGPAAGLAVIAAAIPFHLACSFGLAKMVAAPIEKVLAIKHYRIPKVPAHRRAGFCLVMNVLPVPYTVKNYLMPIAGVPFRLFFWLSWPIQFAMAMPALLAGSSLADMEPLFLVVAILIFAGIYCTVRSIEKRYGGRWAVKDNAC